ncbi:50S ribosomal protein L30e [Candidatus Micrarchaeota archaeon]|nr:50S ribosomal protein L30e [Candidatus Micrarchaeota archaeon]
MAEETEEAEETTEENVEEEKAPKKKKFVRRRKTKKERENPLTTAVRLAVESGKVDFGSRKGIKTSLLGGAKLFVVASNTPDETKVKVEYYAKISKIPVIVFQGSSMELGSVCGRPFPIAVLSIFDAGASNILELVK